MKTFKFIKLVQTGYEQNIEAEDIEDAKKKLNRDDDAWKLDKDWTHVDCVEIYEEEKGNYYRKDVLTWDDWYRKNY